MNATSAFADLVLVNGDVVTLDSRRHRATSVAVRQGRIIAVGDDRTLDEYRGAKTQLVDLGGRTVTPGLIDAHLHPALGVTRAVGIDFAGVTDPAEFLSIVEAEAARIARKPTDGWVRGWNLDYEIFAALPITADSIEHAVRGLPALFLLFDGHTGLASHAALARARVDGPRPFGDTSEIVLDPGGAPTGELREESALALILEAIPEPATAELVRNVQEVFRRLGASGITGACIMDGTSDGLDLLDEVDASASGLPLRIVTALDHSPSDSDELLRSRIALRDRRGARWRGGLIKLYADGVIDTGTGWLYEPDTHGDGLASFWHDPTEFGAVVRRYSDAGFQIATHAIGDRAIGETIDAYLTAPRRAGAAAHRIEHLEALADRDLFRMAAAGITASLQPLHMQWRKADGSDAWSERLGPDRASKAWRVRDLVDAGALVALGSDWPVAQLDARLGMAWARLRRTPGNPDAFVFEPHQRLSAVQALAGFTTWAARAQGDADLGRVSPGFRADLAIWEENPLTVTPDQLPDLPIYGTLVDGVAHYRSPDSELP